MTDTPQRDERVRLLLEMARDWLDPVVARDAPERVPAVIQQLIDELTLLRQERDRLKEQSETRGAETVSSESRATAASDEAVSVADKERALEWAESAGQRREISQMHGLDADLRERQAVRAKRDMGFARELLKLPAVRQRIDFTQVAKDGAGTERPSGSLDDARKP